ncbi:MAG TPA: sensor domain-containing protein, partial [Candidatus Limnocylindrales bacterium]|nr:sensor domain-containing protein [Candidatus Limnocylindrales bacterium]
PRRARDRPRRRCGRPDGTRPLIAGPLLVLGLLLVLSALGGARVAGRGRGAVASFLLSPIDPVSWRATGAILVGAAVEVVAVTVVGGLFSGGVSALIFGIGIVIAGLGIEVCRVVARIERSRVASVDGRPLLAHPYRSAGTTLRGRAEATFLDVNRWRDVVYVFVAFPLAMLEAALVVALWAASIALLSLPVWLDTLGAAGVPGQFRDAAEPWQLAAFAVGVVLAPVAASTARGLVTLHRAVVAGLLCESEQRALQRRVEALEGSRKAVLDVEATELRRIERDLHDGAQQRLVMLTLDLGLAAEKLDADPDRARELVLAAQGQARQALAELRDLVRGIAPAILMDRGLVPAVSALAGRSPVPTTVVSTLPDGERLPDAAERAAYFLIAESLTNVAKHAAATRCEVRVSREGGALVVEVRDDGAGGAEIVPGGGLAGLAGRVEALDGQFSVTSPRGGPTVIRAELPVAAHGPPGRLANPA